MLLFVVQVMSLIGLICAAVFPAQWFKGFGFTTFVFVTGFIYSAVSLSLHIINYFPDMTMAYIVVRLIPISMYTDVSN